MSSTNRSNALAEYEQTLKIGTFLVVDDFDSMRKVTMSQLRHLGAQKILEAGNGSEALKIIEETKKASASYLQRRLSIGYNRAARIIERMEELGYVGPQQGSKPREVYV